MTATPDDRRFPTLAGPGRSGIDVRGSRFVGRVAPARSVPEADTFVEDVTAAHPDATHVVPAYRVRDDPLREWSSDAGEPAGSAGRPVLTVLARRGLENVVAAVVRYYGGTNLGIGGLARAYGRATNEAVDDAGIVERVPHEPVRVRVDYDDSGTVRGILESAGVDFEAEYTAEVSFDALVPATEAEALRDRLRSATRGRGEVE